MTMRWRQALGLLGVAALLGGCSNLPLPQLPDTGKLPDRSLGKTEQRGKVDGMIEKSQTHQSEAAKQIETGR